MGKKKRTISRALLSLSLLSTICVYSQPVAFAAEFEVKSFPVPINVEGERTYSTLFLKFEVHYYNISLEQFGSAINDERERTFFQIADGIRKKDYAQVEQVLRLPNNQNTRSTTSVIAAEKTPKKTVDLYWSAFGGFEHIQVVCQVLLGSRSLFVWQAKTGSVALLRAFAVTIESNNKFVATEVTMNTPLDLLVLNTLEYSAKQPETYKPVVGLKRQYEYAFPIDGPGNAGPHPVYLQFNGQLLDFEVFEDNESSPDDVLRVYRSAFMSLKRKLIDAFLNFHTPKSQTKLRQWYASMPKDVFDSYLLNTTKVRKVRFLLNADPVYLVFYSTEDSKDWKPGSLNYQYLVRDKNSGAVKITNVLFQSFLDDVLKNNELFDQSYLKKAVATVVN